MAAPPDCAPAAGAPAPDGEAEPVLGVATKIIDILAWVLAAPTIAAGLILCPYLLHLVGKFRTLFRELQVPLPAVTRFILTEGWWYFTALPYGVVMVMIVVLVKSRSGATKLMAAVGAQTIVALILASAYTGVFTPIIELQKQLK
jgi:hypothetical protein